MRRSMVVLAGATVLAATGFAAQVASGGQTPVPTSPTPVPFPTGPSFPVAASTIQGWIAKGNMAAEREHAWALWAGLNQASGQSPNGTELRVWETWPDIAAVMSSTATSAALTATAPREVHRFERPRQFHHNKGAMLLETAANTAINVMRKFDPAAAAFVATRQAGPGPAGTTYNYGSSTSLKTLNAAWPAATPVAKRAINPFPTTGFELKPVMMVVKGSGLTIQPLWQGLGGSTNKAYPAPDTWTTCVLIDPAGSGGLRAATPAEVKRADPDPKSACRKFLYGPVSLLYGFKMTAGEAAQFGLGAVAGDYAVLVGMHVNTKETPLWTWQTFWWQPGADAPGGFPGTKAGQPAGLAAPFNNYAACASYDQTTTPGGKTMAVCFNPYLETDPSIPVGATSNCMSCHGVALIGPNANYPADYKRPIALFTDPRYFGKTTNTDMSWAVALAPN